MSTALFGLEARIRELPGVMGCVILLTPQGDAGEVQVFTERGHDKDTVQEAIEGEVRRAGVGKTLRVIHVFELEQSHFGDRESLQRALELAEQEARARGPLTALEQPREGAIDLVGFRWDASRGLGRRPLLLRVILSASDAGSEAEVSLETSDDREVVASATGEKTPHGLAVVAEATLGACSQLVEGFEAQLLGASLVGVVGIEAVVVLVRVKDHDLMGSALLRKGSASEAAVRATLDAVNRVLMSQ
jgi:hypothetical protein